MQTAARRGTPVAVTCTLLLALPVLVLLPLLVSVMGVSTAPGRDTAPLAAGLLWLVVAALPLIAWFRQSWRPAVPALAIAVVGVGYGLWMFLGGLEAARQDCRQIFCDLGMYIGPVIAGYFAAVTVPLALLVRALRPVPTRPAAV